MRKFIQTSAYLNKSRVLKGFRLILVAFYLLVLLSIGTSSSPVEAQSTQTVSGTANEGWGLELSAPEGAVFTDVVFASYGTPNEYTVGWCHSETSVENVFQKFVGNQSGTITATNDVFGDPCVGTYKKLEVVLAYEYVVPQYYLNVPTNVQVTVLANSILLTWDAPVDSGTVVERYAIFWSTNGYAGWAVASTETFIEIPLDVIAQAGFSLDYSFSIRADNDSLAVYSEQSSSVSVFVDKPVEPTPEPTPTPTPTETVVEPTPEPTPVVPSPQPTLPTPEPSKTQEPTPTPTPTNTPEPQPEPDTPSTVDELLENLEEGESVSAEQLAELGIDYSELPPDTPVQLENGVIILAEVADAIEIFENPAELLSTVFTDPSKALTAIANVGADLPADVREEAQKVAVPAVIVTQVIAGTASMLMRRI